MKKTQYNLGKREVSGRNYFTVSWTANGKRYRRSFTTRKSAENFIEHQRRSERLPAWFDELTPGQQADVLTAAARARDEGVSLTAALDHYLSGQSREEIRYDKAVAAYLETLRAAKRSKGYITGTRQDLTAFGWSGMVGEIQEEDVFRHLSKWSGATRNSKLRRIRVFLNWAVRSGYAAANAAANVSLHRETHETQIFTVDQTRKIMQAAVKEGVGRYFGIGFYTGMRPWEIMRLEPGDVLDDHIVVRASASKTGKRRVVPIPDILRPYLAGGTVTNETAMKRARLRVRSRCGITWIQDGMRHTFASHHLALHGDASKTATILGDNVSTVHRHYIALVTATEGAAYFAACPSHIAR